MAYCPNGHGEQSGRFCPECGASLSASPPPSNDSIRIRSPQAHAVASVSPTFVLPGGVTEVPPVYVKCPWCGRRNPEAETFDCQGACGRQNLCLRHFDEEYEVCRQCSQTLRGEDRAQADQQARLQAELEQWRRRAEAAEARVSELTSQAQRNEAALAQARDELEAARVRIAALERELAGWQQRAEKAEAKLAEALAQGQRGQAALEQARAELWEARQRIGRLERELADWRRRAEKAEAKLAEIERREQEAEEPRRHEEGVVSRKRVHCKVCGRRAPVDARFCLACGAVLV